MYRQPQRPGPTPPTRIEYVSRLLRIRGFVIGAIILGVASFLFAMIHATHFTCSRAQRVCVISNYALIAGARQRDISIDNIVMFRATKHKGSKGSTYAVAEIVNRSEETISLADGVLIPRFDPTSAFAARDAYESFAQHPEQQELDVWLSQGWPTYLVSSIFGALLALLGFVMLREQLVQLRPILVVVDHDRNVVIIRGREVPIDTIATVRVEQGRALFWASGKNEIVPGWRLILLTKDIGEEIPATKDFRGGNISDHNRARDALKKALAITQQ